MALVWEELVTENLHVNKQVEKFSWAKRAKVPGGWLVAIKTFDFSGLTFYPDPQHVWDGNSLP